MRVIIYNLKSKNKRIIVIKCILIFLNIRNVVVIIIFWLPNNNQLIRKFLGIFRDSHER